MTNIPSIGSLLYATDEDFTKFRESKTDAEKEKLTLKKFDKARNLALLDDWIFENYKTDAKEMGKILTKIIVKSNKVYFNNYKKDIFSSKEPKHIVIKYGKKGVFEETIFKVTAITRQKKGDSKEQDHCFLCGEKSNLIVYQITNYHTQKSCLVKPLITHLMAKHDCCSHKNNPSRLEPSEVCELVGLVNKNSNSP